MNRVCFWLLHFSFCSNFLLQGPSFVTPVDTTILRQIDSSFAETEDGVQRGVGLDLWPAGKDNSFVANTTKSETADISSEQIRSE